ncbi:MAG: RNA polymerase sigma factor [Thermodesulfobacteriota bacterium]|nr:RNA polymerase sigma factor [Thermodesulfobacteriota bacterium]
MAHLDQAQSQTRMSGTGGQVTSLVERARGGDREAFGRLVELFQGPIFRMVYYRTRLPMDAEDLTQEIFVKAFKNLSKLRDPKRFRTWLFRMAVNRVADFYRKKRLLAIFKTRDQDGEKDSKEAEAQQEAPSALDDVIKEEFWKHVTSFSENLSRREKEVFFLRFMDHLSIREIAQVLDRSESAVKTHLYRGLKKFKEDPSLLQLLEASRP